MAVTHNWYGQAFITMANKEADWDTDVVKTMISTVTYVPNQNTDKYKSSVTNEVTGTNYTAGGATISPLTSAEAALVWNLDGADAAWTTVTFTGGRIAATYDNSPATDATRPLLSYVNFGAETDPVTGGAPSGDSEIVSETGTIGVLVQWPSYAFGYRRLDVVSETGPGP